MLAREHHYQASIHARMLRDNRSHTLGLVVPEITNHGFAVFLMRWKTCVARRAYSYLFPVRMKMLVRSGSWWII